MITGPVPAWIVNASTRVCALEPEAVPVTVILYVPGDKVFVPLSVTVTELPGVMGLAEKETDVPTGLPVAESEIGLLNPPATMVPKVVDMLVGAGQAAVCAPGVENV